MTMATSSRAGDTADGEIILAARDVSKSYGEAQRSVLVLDRINLEIRAGQFIALLGPSGSGKSTLLRILAGLLAASQGEVLVHGQVLHGANPQIAMVFQSFALYPWLTVLDNVELGLLVKDLPAAERRDRALKAIDLIGLDGFEQAYPRELSGGMRQRVGFARALVVEPEVLFMDEPFSALDVLVAENLRHELLDLWLEKSIPTRAILMVTHNIDEAVGMADRLLVFGADPGHIRAELPGLPVADRRRKGAAHAEAADTCYRIMTNPKADVAKLISPTPAAATLPPRLHQMLPRVAIGDLSGFIERLQSLGGREPLYRLARDLQMEADDLLPIVDAADLLGFADVQEGDVLLTPAGNQFARADVLEKKKIFSREAAAGIELIGEIRRELDENHGHRLPQQRILAQLEQSFTNDEAKRQLQTAIAWGRYAELFAFDDAAGEFFLEPDMVSEPG